MIKKIVFLLVVTLAIIGGFLWYKLIGFQQINPLPRLTSTQLKSFETNMAFKKFIENFQPVELPLQIISSSINYSDWPKIENTGFLPNINNAGEVLRQAGVDISNIPQIALDAIIEKTPNSDVKPAVSYYLLSIQNNQVVCLFLLKEYNNQTRTKQTKLYLVSYQLDGSVIDSQLIATESIVYDMTNDTQYEQYFMVRFEADLTIKLKLKTYSYVAARGYSTSGWVSQLGWQINPSGQIQKEQPLPIVQDE